VPPHADMEARKPHVLAAGGTGEGRRVNCILHVDMELHFLGCEALEYIQKYRRVQCAKAHK
jgi:hypothetical protein